MKKYIAAGAVLFYIIVIILAVSKGGLAQETGGITETPEATPPDQVQDIPPEDINDHIDSVIQDPNAVRQLTPEQMQNLDDENLQLLIEQRGNELTETQVQSLDSEQVALVITDSSAGPEVKGKLSSDQIRGALDEGVALSELGDLSEYDSKELAAALSNQYIECETDELGETTSCEGAPLDISEDSNFDGCSFNEDKTLNCGGTTIDLASLTSAGVQNVKIDGDKIYFEYVEEINGEIRISRIQVNGASSLEFRDGKVIVDGKEYRVLGDVTLDVRDNGDIYATGWGRINGQTVVPTQARPLEQGAMNDGLFYYDTDNDGEYDRAFDAPLACDSQQSCNFDDYPGGFSVDCSSGNCPTQPSQTQRPVKITPGPDAPVITEPDEIIPDGDGDVPSTPTPNPDEGEDDSPDDPVDDEPEDEPDEIIPDGEEDNPDENNPCAIDINSPACTSWLADQAQNEPDDDTPPADCMTTFDDRCGTDGPGIGEPDAPSSTNDEVVIPPGTDVSSCPEGDGACIDYGTGGGTANVNRYEDGSQDIAFTPESGGTMRVPAYGDDFRLEFDTRNLDPSETMRVALDPPNTFEFFAEDGTEYGQLFKDGDLWYAANGQVYFHDTGSTLDASSGSYFLMEGDRVSQIRLGSDASFTGATYSLTNPREEDYMLYLVESNTQHGEIAQSHDLTHWASMERRLSSTSQGTIQTHGEVELHQVIKQENENRIAPPITAAVIFNSPRNAEDEFRLIYDSHFDTNELKITFASANEIQQVHASGNVRDDHLFELNIGHHKYVEDGAVRLMHVSPKPLTFLHVQSYTSQFQSALIKEIDDDSHVQMGNVQMLSPDPVSESHLELETQLYFEGTLMGFR